MALKVSIRVKNNNRLITRGKEHLRAQVPKIAKGRLKKAANELKRRLSKAGKKSKRPVSWDNVKQMRYVLMMLRKSKRLPYKRTHKHRRGWKVVVLKSGYSVENRVPGSVHIYGDKMGNRQSRIHQGRWNKFADQTNIVLKNLPKTVQRELVEVVKKMPNKEPVR